MEKFNFKGREESYTLEALVKLYESQIINMGDAAYINGLAQLIKSRFEEHGLVDYEVLPTAGVDERNTLDVLYAFEEKVKSIISFSDENKPWIPLRVAR